MARTCPTCGYQIEQWPCVACRARAALATGRRPLAHVVEAVEGVDLSREPAEATAAYERYRAAHAVAPACRFGEPLRPVIGGGRHDTIADLAADRSDWFSPPEYGE